jgi:hypothetical protein
MIASTRNLRATAVLRPRGEHKPDADQRAERGGPPIQAAPPACCSHRARFALCDVGLPSRAQPGLSFSHGHTTQKPGTVAMTTSLLTAGALAVVAAAIGAGLGGGAKRRPRGRKENFYQRGSRNTRGAAPSGATGDMGPQLCCLSHTSGSKHGSSLLCNLSKEHET